MNEPANLTQKITELETKVSKLEIATLVILNLIMIVYLLTK